MDYRSEMRVHFIDDGFLEVETKHKIEKMVGPMIKFIGIDYYKDQEALPPAVAFCPLLNETHLEYIKQLRIILPKTVIVAIFDEKLGHLLNFMQGISLEMYIHVKLDEAKFLECLEAAFLSFNQKKASERHSSAFFAANEGFLLLNREGRIRDANPSFLGLAQRASAYPFMGASPNEFVQAVDNITIRWDEERRYEVVFRDTSPPVYALASIGPYDMETFSRLVTFTQISEIREREALARKMATTDALTGLPNRSLVMDRIQQALIRANREKVQVGILFIDLDRFKQVNDTYGHQAGDELLIQVSKRLTKALRASDTVARLSGDEFLALLPAVHGNAGSEMAARKIISSLEEPFELSSGVTAHISCSIGTAIFPNDSTSMGELLEKADAAMYVSKRSGRGTVRHANGEIPPLQILQKAFLDKTVKVMFKPFFNSDGILNALFSQIVVPEISTKEDLYLLSEKAGLAEDFATKLLAESSRATLSVMTRKKNTPVTVKLPFGIASNLGADDFIRKIIEENACHTSLLEISIPVRDISVSYENVKSFIQKMKDMSISCSFWGYGDNEPKFVDMRSLGIDKALIGNSFIENALRNPSLAKMVIDDAKNTGITPLAEWTDIDNLQTLDNMGFSVLSDSPAAPAMSISQCLDLLDKNLV